MKIAVRLSYIGKNYCGWQRQPKEGLLAPKLPSIQEIVEGAISTVTDTETKVVASGRTDAGVHALCQIIHFKVQPGRLSFDNIKRGLNTLLPPDIRVIEVFQVADDFHAQQSAIKKQYSYYFQQGPCPLPQWMDTTWWIYRTLNVQAMNEGLQYLLGEHDFKAFQAKGSKPDMNTVRTLFEAEVTREPMPAFPGQDLNERGFSVVRVRLVGSGFLKQMVRGIAGTLLQIGENQRNPLEMREVLLSKDRAKVGATSPAKGLTLERVWYKPDLYGNTN